MHNIWETPQYSLHTTVYYKQLTWKLNRLLYQKTEKYFTFCGVGKTEGLTQLEWKVLKRCKHKQLLLSLEKLLTFEATELVKSHV